MRAREHAREDRLFEEPLASLLATEEGPRIMCGFEGEVQRGIEDPALAVRTRFFDEAIMSAAHDHQVQQMVFVAAGMDTRSYRLAWPKATTLFELDRPALLKLKAELLADAGPDVQPVCTVISIGVDLLGDWTAPLVASGFRSLEPTLWLVEGLLYFLSVDERDGLLKEITSLSAPGSWFLADYVSQTSLDGPGMRAWRVKMAAGGHPWMSGCDDPEALLGAQGWRARVSAYGSPEADYGRWAASVIEPGVTATRGRYLITAMLDPTSLV